MIRVSTANLYLESLQGINADQSAVLNSIGQLSSGKQLNSPADNPVGAAQASMLQSDLTQLGQYSTNQGQATQMLNSASSTLTQFMNVVQTTRTTLVQAGNGSLSDADRSALAAQLQQGLNQLVGLANTSDTQGGFLFGGSVTSTPPFVQNGNNVSYVGDNVVQGLQISQTRTEQIKYAGNSVFMSIPTGNGTFATAAAPGNTGTGTISAGTVTTPSSLTGDNYSITILPGGTNYQVNDLTKGTTVVPSTALGNPTTLSFDGMQMTLSGAPAAGDSFTVAPSGTQSVFSVLASAITALQTPSSTAAAAAQRTAAVTTALGNTDQALTSLEATQSAMGSQLSELNSYSTVNGDRTLQDKTEMSSIVDLNYANGASKLAQQQTQYQAALQSYSAISKLSLFNYLN
jgi:flagellar hook-associated protein 3 FlgL